jgi:hypothetical protein
VVGITAPKPSEGQRGSCSSDPEKFQLKPELQGQEQSCWSTARTASVTQSPSIVRHLSWLQEPGRLLYVLSEPAYSIE